MKKKYCSWPFIILGYFVLVYLFPLGFHALFSPDEIRYAEVSREMVSSGNWIVPHFNELRYFEKPIMAYWLNAISQIFFGENNFSVRLPSTLSTLSSAYFLYILVRKETKDISLAWITCGIFLSMFMVIAVGTYNSVDSILSFFLTGSFVTFYYAFSTNQPFRKVLLYFVAGLFCGAAFLTKGFLALALPVIVVGGFSIWQKKLWSLIKYGPISILGALVVSLPWSIAIHHQAPDFWRYFFWIEHVKRFLGNSHIAQHSQPWWYYLPFVLIGILPWLFIAFSLLKETLKNRDVPLIRFALLWVLLPLIFFSASTGKIATYILPCMAPIAILLGYGIKDVFDKKSKTFKLGSFLHVLCVLVLVIAIFVLSSLNKVPLDSTEQYKVWLFALIFLTWAIFVVISLRVNELKKFVIVNMLAPLCLILMFGAMLPNVTKASKLPEYLIGKISTDITPDTLIIADYPSTMSAFNWYLKRTDIYLTGGRGEVHYGLNYVDSKHRYIPLNKLANFINTTRTSQPVLVEFKGMPVLPDNFPNADKVIKYGKFNILFFYRLSE